MVPGRLTAAAELAGEGFEVMVLDHCILRMEFGNPAFSQLRLSKNFVNREMDYIRQLGFTIEVSID